MRSDRRTNKMYKRYYMIKLFEEYSQYYTHITYPEYVELCRVNRESLPVTTLMFDDSEVNMIKKNVKKVIYNVKYTPGRNFIQGYITITFVDHDEFPSIRVYKLHDEWFIVDNFSSHYKCDQIEGLIKCINEVV